MSDRSKRGGAASAAQRTRTPALSRRRFGILVIPYLWLVGAITVVGYLHGRILGVPVLEVWMLAGVVVCSVCLAAASHGRPDPLAEYVQAWSAQEDQQ